MIVADEAKTPEKPENPYSWLTPEVLTEFLHERGVPSECNLCGQNAWLIDTGSDDGYVPRSIIFPLLRKGVVNTGDGRYLPVARMRCMNCGNLRYHDMFPIQMWRAKRLLGQTTEGE